MVPRPPNHPILPLLHPSNNNDRRTSSFSAACTSSRGSCGAWSYRRSSSTRSTSSTSLRSAGATRQEGFEMMALDGTTRFDGSVDRLRPCAFLLLPNLQLHSCNYDLITQLGARRRPQGPRGPEPPGLHHPPLAAHAVEAAGGRPGAGAGLPLDDLLLADRGYVRVCVLAGCLWQGRERCGTQKHLCSTAYVTLHNHILHTSHRQRPCHAFVGRHRCLGPFPVYCLLPFLLRSDQGRCR